MNHELKILPPHFNAVLDGRKTFEIRKDDRGFKAGDTVTLREYDPMWEGYCRSEESVYTGRVYKAQIGYVTTYEQQLGYVVFSLVANAQVKAASVASPMSETNEVESGVRALVTKERDMDKCIMCGSYAINHRLHGRDGSDPDLCDVCYWRKRADDASDVERAACEELRNHEDVLAPIGNSAWG